MPFMKGIEPVRRTLKYLKAGRLVLKDNIHIFSINYNTYSKAHEHEGIKDFIFWHMAQVQFKNPEVQVITFKNMTPTPFIKCYYENGKKMLIDVYDKDKDEILDHLIKVVGKTRELLAKEAILREKKDNPANFGYGCEKSCMCTIFGQVPCPQVVPLPHHFRGKYRWNQEVL